METEDLVVRGERRVRKKMRLDDESACIKQMMLLRHNRVLDVPEEVGDGLDVPEVVRNVDYALITYNDSKLFISPYDESFKPKISYEKKKYDGLVCPGSSNVVWGSKLFFISGKYPSKGYHCTSSVFAFDLIKKNWITDYKPIQTPRAFHTVVAVRGIIYVFGNFHWNPLPGECWGEQFNIQENEWKYLPRPPKPLYTIHESKAHAVYYNCQPFFYTTRARGKSWRCFVPKHQNLILFPLFDRSPSICVFNCNTNQWLSDIYPLNLRRHRRPIYPYHMKMFRDRQVVVDGVLFWHYSGSIHGYDLIDEKCLPSLFTIPFHKIIHKSHAYDDDYGCYFPPMYLVHPESCKLFLFFQFECNNVRIHYLSFEIHRNKQGRPRRLDLKLRSRISTKSINQDSLQDVLLFPSPSAPGGCDARS